MSFDKFRKIMLCLFGIAAIASVFILSSKVDAMTTVRPLPSSNFDYAMQTVLKHEGRLSNDKNDPGGLTAYGISLRFLKFEKIDVDGDGDSDADDIKALTLTKADEIYLRTFWNRNHYDKIKDRYVATKILDGSVNFGASRMHKIIKSSLNEIFIEQIKVNANFDDKTIDMINHIEPVVFLDTVRRKERDFYLEIIKRNNALLGFKRGWLARADAYSFHCANERRVSPQHGSILKRMGVTSGVPDIAIMIPKNGFNGLFIELKVKPNKPTPAQLKFLETLNINGYLAVVRYGANEAIKTIQEYLDIPIR